MELEPVVWIQVKVGILTCMLLNVCGQVCSIVLFLKFITVITHTVLSLDVMSVLIVIVFILISLLITCETIFTVHCNILK